MKRFTKKGDVVLDGFLGYGTTLIESQKLGRNAIGVKLVPSVAVKYKSLAEIGRISKLHLVSEQDLAPCWCCLVGGIDD